jgi:hypothetical protein
MNRKPYLVEFGYHCHNYVAFEEFDEALVFYEGYSVAKNREPNYGTFSTDDGPRIVNLDHTDGSEDGNSSGLTQEQKEAIDAVDEMIKKDKN